MIWHGIFTLIHQPHMENFEWQTFSHFDAPQQIQGKTSHQTKVISLLTSTEPFWVSRLAQSAEGALERLQHGGFIWCGPWLSRNPWRQSRVPGREISFSESWVFGQFFLVELCGGEIFWELGSIGWESWISWDFPWKWGYPQLAGWFMENHGKSHRSKWMMTGASPSWRAGNHHFGALRNGFQSINELDTLGWRPLHYAAMNGEPSLLQALLEQRATLDSKTKKQNPYTGIPQFMTALSISLFFKNHLATQFLLEKGANTSSGLIPPVDFASMANNPEGLRMLRSTFNSGDIPDRYLDS